MSTFNSLCARDVKDPRTIKPHILPLYLTSSYAYESIDHQIDVFTGKASGHVYSRYGNPTIEAVGDKIAAMETYGLDVDAQGIMVSSGMAAIHTLVMSVLRSGDTILTQGDLYGGTTELLLKVASRAGVKTILADLKDIAAVEALIQQNPSIKMVYFETPSNPTLACLDIQALCDICRSNGRISAIDNTFLTPYLQQPFKFGVDFVIHSTTKFLNGHGNSIAGAIVGRAEAMTKGSVWETMKLIGTNPGPMDAWLLHQGMKTLTLRMDRHCENAMGVAQFLASHHAVTRVNYLGLPSHPDHELAKRQMTNYGGMLSFEVAGGMDGALAFLRNVKFCTLAPTLGDVDTLILHPVTSSHLKVDPEVRVKNGITDGLIRMSVGIEGIEDIVDDLRSALPS